MATSSLTTFHKQNPKFTLQTADLLDDQAVSKLNFKGLDKAQTLAQLKAQQRLEVLSPDPATAEKLVAAGLDSAHMIAQMTENDFVAKHGKDLGGAETAETIYQTATTRKAQSQHLWASLRPEPYAASVKALQNTQQIKETFQSLPSYQELFGNLDFCECAECKSLYGPAAYFVDLLRLIEKGITQPNPNIPKGLKLFERRPDLVEIPLTCEKTNHLVPYLQIVNEVLERTVEEEFAPIKMTNALQFVSHQKFPFILPYNQPLTQIRTYLGHFKRTLADIFHAFDPTGADAANTARERLQISLQEKTIYTAAPSAQLEKKLIQEFNVNLKAGYWGGLYKLPVFMEKTGLSRKEVTSLLHLNLSEQELNESKGVIPHTFFINQSSQPGQYQDIRLNTTDPGSPFEEVGPPTLATFERMGTFIRLSQRLGWSFSDLNWALTTIQADMSADGIDKTLEQLAGIQQLSQSLMLDIPSLCVLWYDIKTIGQGNGPESMAPFDVLFNNNTKQPYHPKAEKDDPFFANPLYTDEPVPWLVQGLTTPAELPLPKTSQAHQPPQILSVLPVRYEGLLMLAHVLWGKGDALESFVVPLTVTRLSTLYRHVLLSLKLNLSIPSYLKLLELKGLLKAGNPANTGLLTVAEVIDISSTANWLAAHDLNAFEVDFIKKGTLSPFVQQRYSSASLITFLQALLPHLHKDLIQKNSFAHHKIEASTSAKLFENLLIGGYINQVGIITKEITSTAKGIFKGIDKLEGDKASRAYVISFLQQQAKKQIASFVAQASTFLGASTKDMAALVAGIKGMLDMPFFLKYMTILPIIEISVKESVKERVKILPPETVYKAFRNSELTIGSSEHIRVKQLAPGYWKIRDKVHEKIYFADVIEETISEKTTIKIRFLANVGAIKESQISEEAKTFMACLARHYQLVHGAGISETAIAALYSHPDAFGIADLKTLTFADIQQVYEYASLHQAFDDKQDDLLAFLELAQQADATSEALLMSLSLATGWERSEIQLAIEAFYSKVSACKTIPQIVTLKRVFDLSRTLGLGIKSLQAFDRLRTLINVLPNWPTYTELASVMLAAVKADVKPADWPAVQQQLDQPILEATRDALVSLLIWKLGMRYKGLKNPRDLYEFLFIDVENAGCREISYIKEGLNAAQLYLQRCRLGEEEHVTISPENIPPIYWEWIMNYRIWQANREVFLYPENYLNPTLRKEKTALFSDFEKELSQGQTSEEVVEMAFMNYMNQFEALGTLDIVEGYETRVKNAEGEEEPTLFIFGRTKNTPYRYYYLTCTHDGVWSQWHKIDLAIQSQYITPVYAFGRLFVFWVEMTVKKDTDPSGKKNSNGSPPKMKVYQATIKYS